MCAGRVNPIPTGANARKTIVAVALTAALLPPPARAGACWHYNDRERKLLSKINHVRSNADSGTLRRDPELSKVAKRHSRRMARKRTVSHTGNLGQLVTNWSVLAENVGKARGVRQMHRAFMKSSLHRSNILDGVFGRVGVGVIKARGRVWVTEVFEAVDNPGTTLRMPTC